MEYATGTSRATADGRHHVKPFSERQECGVSEGHRALKSQTPVLGSDSSSVTLSPGARFLMEKHEDNDNDLTESV